MESLGGGPAPSLRDLSPGLDEFRREVLEGLRRRPRELPCKYFYDARGSELFERICGLGEYYLTRAETALFARHAGEMARLLGPGCMVIEPGAGSAQKTRRLLDRMGELAAYVPVDISGEFLARTARELADAYPGAEILPVCADFTRPFRLPRPRRPARRRVLFFPGSTIGNFHPHEAAALLRRWVRLCRPGGAVLVGIDLEKDRALLEPAYDDARGVTAEFNRNLLVRINRELGADFRPEAFRHRAVYNAEAGRMELDLVSEKDQTVRLGGERFRFRKGEAVRTEYSYKYSLEKFGRVAAAAGLAVACAWTDPRGWFGEVLLTGASGL